MSNANYFKTSDGTIIKIGSDGTEVVANNGQATTEDLRTLQVGDINYKVPSGGGTPSEEEIVGTFVKFIDSSNNQLGEINLEKPITNPFFTKIKVQLPDLGDTYFTYKNGIFINSQLISTEAQIVLNLQILFQENNTKALFCPTMTYTGLEVPFSLTNSSSTNEYLLVGIKSALKNNLNIYAYVTSEALVPFSFTLDYVSGTFQSIYTTKPIEETSSDDYLTIYKFGITVLETSFQISSITAIEVAKYTQP